MRAPLAFALFFIPPLLVAQTDAWNHVQRNGELRWCADESGGAPYVFPDEKNPKQIIGFEVDLMRAVGQDLNVRPKLVLGPWEDLVPMLLRDDCDVVVNGLEITSEREKIIDFSIPYYFFSEQLTARKGDLRINALEDLHHRRVGTLAASLAESLLKEDPTITPVDYPSAVEAYKDLQLGRIDAVFMDDMIAAWYADPNSNLRRAGNPVGLSGYGAGVRKDNPLIRQKLNDTLRRLIQSGALEKIYRRWNLWNPAQLKLRQFAEGQAGERRNEKAWWKFFPLLLQGAGVTIVISFLAMGMAVILGFLLCFGKLYGGPTLTFLCNTYIEVIRGTPLLIQLYLLYYGLPNLGIQLNAMSAAILGMGMNYAAYEAEIYRAGLLAISKGQSDAARSLGMTRNQTLAYILLPQAFRTILPPSTNDFIALFKDTSLVSIITVAELTKAYGTAATTTYRFLELGLVTAALYFAMSYPLSIWSRTLEEKRHAALH